MCRPVRTLVALTNRCCSECQCNACDEAVCVVQLVMLHMSTVWECLTSTLCVRTSLLQYHVPAQTHSIALMAAISHVPSIITAHLCTPHTQLTTSA